MKPGKNDSDPFSDRAVQRGKREKKGGGAGFEGAATNTGWGGVRKQLGQEHDSLKGGEGRRSKRRAGQILNDTGSIGNLGGPVSKRRWGALSREKKKGVRGRGNIFTKDGHLTRKKILEEKCGERNKPRGPKTTHERNCGQIEMDDGEGQGEKRNHRGKKARSG